jgi:GntR family transcriptional regulator/MocR family aminotransferase
MPRSHLLLDWIALDSAAAPPLYRQLYTQLRSAVVEGRLAAGSLMPSSRVLAQELGVSRNTVLNAYEQLAAEGYFETSEASATLVSRLPVDGAALPTNGAEPAPDRPETADAAMPAYSQCWLALQESAPVLDLPEAVAFTPGVPAFDQFPARIWGRLLANHAYRMHPEMADNDVHIGGYGPLREALTTSLRASRMVDCQPDQVLVVSAARAGLDLVCRVLAEAGASALVEDPGYNTAKTTLRAAGISIAPVPVDGEGMRIDVGESSAPDARLAYVTPSHQWPTGVSLSAARRQELLRWAGRRNAWIVEDDYDSEFRYAGRPLATLQGLDGGKRVIYLGTFSKVMFPSLRVGYIVVPQSLVAVFRKALYYAGQEPPLHVQAALADFIHDGHFSAHIRKMRRVYKRRQGAVVDELFKHIGHRIPVERPPGGMQMALTLPPEYRAADVSQAAARAGLHVRSFDLYSHADSAPNALHLGFAAVSDRGIRPAAEALANAILASGPRGPA